MLENVKRFDMKRPPQRQKLRWLIHLLAKPALKKHNAKLRKVNMEGIKAPYLLLVNHNAFLDFKIVAEAIRPARQNFIVAIDGFIKREGLLRMVGGICKRKFTRDINVVYQFKKVIENGDIAVMYPEARYSLCGTTAVLPDSLGKLAKLFKVPVVVMITKGHHINSPFWNLHDNNIQGIEATMTCICDGEEIKTIPVDELNRRIREAFVYDDFAWQRDNKIENTYEKRAEGLEKVLYQCPACGTEYEMHTKDNHILCSHCHKEWEMSIYGELHALDGKEIFTHIPDWYEWERENVRKEVKNGTYHFESEVHIDALPNAKGYIPMGKGTLIHDMNGFKVIFKDQNNEELFIPREEQYSCHIEYNYLGKYGDCVDLNTLDDTFYIYPECEKFSVTKLALATEELYQDYFDNKRQL